VGVRLLVHTHCHTWWEDRSNGAHDWQAGVIERGRGGVAVRGGLRVLGAVVHAESSVDGGGDAACARRLERFMHLLAGPLGSVSACSIPCLLLVLPSQKLFPGSSFTIDVDQSGSRVCKAIAIHSTMHRTCSGLHGGQTLPQAGLHLCHALMMQRLVQPRWKGRARGRGAVCNEAQAAENSARVIRPKCWSSAGLNVGGFGNVPAAACVAFRDSLREDCSASKLGDSSSL
jgi:hypothetical protein